MPCVIMQAGNDDLGRLHEFIASNFKRGYFATWRLVADLSWILAIRDHGWNRRGTLFL